jgi:TPR repeat protein
MRSNRQKRWTAAILPGLLALTLGSTPVRAASSVLLPPDLDYAKHCAAIAAPLPALDRDWTAWAGEAVDTPPEELIALATEYQRGSERVEKSPETALRLLTYLETQQAVGRVTLDRLIGRILVEPGRSEAELKDGETRLARALAAGEPRAALDLARLYGPGGPSGLRNAEKARAYAQVAAASGDAYGKLLFAGILNADPNVPAEQKSQASDAALLSLIGEVVAGNCGYLNTIGQLYLRGDLVAQDVPVAIEWFKQAAETGDAVTQERLGDLIAGSRVEINDFELALSYYQLAADQGRVPAANKLGQEYATGLIRPRDLDRAKHYFGIAAEGGLREADLWLARIYHGDYGGTPDWAQASVHYRAALSAGVADLDLKTEFGIALMENGTTPADRDEAKSVLTDAALLGSGIAAVKVGEMLLDEARTNPALYAEVETFMRLGDTLGRSEAARHMAELSLCAGPLFSPEAARDWTARSVALGANAQTLNEGRRLLASPRPEDRQRGQALVREVAMGGDAKAVGYALAQLQSPSGVLGEDAALRDRLQGFVDGNAGDPAFTRDFQLAFIAAEVELNPGTLDTALKTLDTYIAEHDADALMLKVQLLKDYREAQPPELLPLYGDAAGQGVSKSMREFGAAMLEDPTSDLATARSWLEKAAAAGDVKAALRLVDTTSDTAMTQLKTIAESGTVCSVDTMVTVAKTYAATIDPTAPAEAARWLETATTAAGDSPADLLRIASAYRDSVAGPTETGRAEPLLARAMQLGDPDAAFELAEGHIKGTWPDASVDTAHQLLAGLAADGNAEAAVQLLRAVADGDIEMPATEIASLVDRSRGQLADAGGVLAKLARLDEEGAFGTPNPETRFEWLQLAAHAGDAGAMMRLYRSYASGIGVAASADLAIGWLQKAADIGDPRAAKELAAAYTVGFGTDIDPERAAFWRARAEVVN